MTYTTIEARSLPTVSSDTIGAMFIAGFVGTTAFDIWGQLVSPGLGYANLSPHGLARSLLGNLDLPNGRFLGYYVHFYLVGLIAYPAGWLYGFKPLFALFAKSMHWSVSSALYGLTLWIFAIGGVTAVAGLPFFLNFTGITWVALAGHVLYGVTMGAALAAVEHDRR